MVITTILEGFRFLRIMLFPRLFLFFKRKGDSTVVVSMTTLPSRIKNIAPTLASLFDQTVPPSKIILNLPKWSVREERGYLIPDFIKKDTRIEIIVSAVDYGPGTKLLPALRKYAEDDVKIIVADDDEIYNKGIIENYLKFEHLAVKGALTLAGWDKPQDYIHANRYAFFGAEGSITKNSEAIDSVRQVDCLQGASTYLVSPSFFTEDIFDYDKVPKEAFFVDDIYFSGYLASKEIPIYVVPAPFRYTRIKDPVHKRRSVALHRTENRSGHNNKVLYKYFETYWPSGNVVNK
jgi:hypothetical protein